MVEDAEGNMKNANDMVYVGMIFESEDDAYEKYNEFARKVGFGIRKGNSYKRPDGTVRSRVFVCFKEGFRQNDHRAKNVREHKETRTGCKACMMIKQNEDEWVASSITFEHNHLLLTPRKAPMLRSHRSMKDGSVSEDVHLVAKLALKDALKKIESAIKASQDASTNTMRSKDSTRLAEEHLTVAEGWDAEKLPVKDVCNAPEAFSRNLECVENDNMPYIPHGFEANHIPGLHHNVTGFPHGLDARHVPSLDHNMPHIPHDFEASQSMRFEVYPINTGDTFYLIATTVVPLIFLQGSSAPALEIGDASYPTFTQLLQRDSRFHGFESHPPTGFKVCSTKDGDTASMQPSVLNSMPQPLIRNNMQSFPGTIGFEFNK
ncbi:hypothetical protein IFM89_036621, partial [Coptis chinensis]